MYRNLYFYLLFLIFAIPINFSLTHAKDSLIDAKLINNFSYLKPGVLFPKHSGKGSLVNRIYAPDIEFPLEIKDSLETPMPSSIVYAYGGQHGPKGSQFNKQHYLFPIRDNFCERRGHKTPLCPSGRGHQGCDIRAEKNANVLAVDDGEIIRDAQRSTLKLKSTSGSKLTYVYRHLTLASVRNTLKSKRFVKKGEVIGKVGNIQGIDKNGKKILTYYHLHLEIKGTTTYKNKTYFATPLPCMPSLTLAMSKYYKGVQIKTINGEISSNPKFEMSYEQLIKGTHPLHKKTNAKISINKKEKVPENKETSKPQVKTERQIKANEPSLTELKNAIDENNEEINKIARKMVDLEKMIISKSSNDKKIKVQRYIKRKKRRKNPVIYYY